MDLVVLFVNTLFKKSNYLMEINYPTDKELQYRFSLDIQLADILQPDKKEFLITYCSEFCANTYTLYVINSRFLFTSLLRQMSCNMDVSFISGK